MNPRPSYCLWRCLEDADPAQIYDAATNVLSQRLSQLDGIGPG